MMDVTHSVIPFKLSLSKSLIGSKGIPVKNPTVAVL